MRIFSLILAASLALFSFTGCGPKHSGKVVQLPFPDITSFHPAYWQSQHMLCQGTLFEGLFGYAPDPKGLGGVKVIPAIADSYKVSPDGLVWTFKLRKDKKWSDGQPITARDFEWSYKYYCGPDLKDLPLWASVLGSVKNAWAIKAGGIPVDQLGVRAIDDYTLELTLADPDFNLQLGLVSAGMMPVNRACVEADPMNWWKPGKLVCNGPYIVKSWTQGKDCVLVKNTNYVGECGNVDTIVLKFMVPGMEMGIQSFQAHELDCAFINNVGQYNYVLNNPALKADFHEEISDLVFQGYEISRSFDPVLDDVRLRKAFAMAIDRETLVKKIMGDRAIAGYAFWDENSQIGRKLKPIEFSIEKAKKLLAEAGYPDGKGLPVLKFYITGPSDPIAEYIVNEWKKNLGIQVAIENLEAGLYWNIVWTPSPTIRAGFVRFGGPMNRLGINDLAKNGGHVLYFFDYPAPIRKQMYEMDRDQRNTLRGADKGKIQADWDGLIAKRNTFWAAQQVINANEPNKYWKRTMTRTPSFAEQFDSLYDQWKKETDPMNKVRLWRTAAAELVLNLELDQLKYNSMTPALKNMNRLSYDINNMSWDAAVAAMPRLIQQFQDTYYMVPLYLDKVQYLQNPKLSGVMTYKFAWGPLVFFDFKYLNLAD